MNKFSYSQRIRQCAVLNDFQFKNASVYPENRCVLCQDCRTLNLFQPILDDCLGYFENYKIHWWNVKTEIQDNLPTGHLLSSQIHCLNHLFAFRKDKDIVLSIVKNIGRKIGVEFDNVLPSLIDNQESTANYISFEFVYKNKSLLNETHESRGEKCTSVDAFIYAVAQGKKYLIPIEWKYTESYISSTAAIHYGRYKNFVTSNYHLQNWNEIYQFDPYYELGRQSLLMERIIETEPEMADDYLHIVVVPSLNDSMRIDCDRFRETLQPNRQSLFQVISPEELLKPVLNEPKYADLIAYLGFRYWN